MPEKVVPGPVQEYSGIREAVCIHTKKIYDSCRDKDCIEDLRFYPTQSSLPFIERAMSIKAGTAELLTAYIDVEPMGFHKGFFTVDVRYYYRITAAAMVGTPRPAEISGLAVFDKRAILFGSEGTARIFSSSSPANNSDGAVCPLRSNMPTAVVEAVDPIILNMKLVDVCECRPCDCGEQLADVPACILAAFGEDLVFSGDTRRIYVTLGQFSIIRLERDSQLLIPVYDYCLPDKECSCSSDDDPCEVFRQVSFPVNDFFPPNTLTSSSSSSSCSCNTGTSSSSTTDNRSCGTR